MARRTRFPVLCLLLLAPMLSGCLYSREIAQTRREVERALPGVRMHREVVLSFGRGTLGLLGGIADFTNDEDVAEASAYLRDIRSVKIGVYRLQSRDTTAARQLNPAKLPRFRKDGWQTVVRARDGDEYVHLLYRERGGQIRDMFIVALDREELVLLRVHGRLTRLFERALAQRDLHRFRRR